jgi:hypothetical protein
MTGPVAHTAGQGLEAASAALYGQVRGIAQQAFPDVVDSGSLVAPFDAILAELCSGHGAASEGSAHDTAGVKAASANVV